MKPDCSLHSFLITLLYIYIYIYIYINRIRPIFIVGIKISGQIKLQIIHVRQYSTLTEKETQMYIIHKYRQSKLPSNIIGKMITLNEMTKLLSFRHTRHQIYHPIVDHQVDVFITRTIVVDTRIKMNIIFMTKAFDTDAVRNPNNLKLL